MNKLDDRLKKILRIIVQSHIDLNSPIGSILIAKKFPVGLSPATIRNTMAKLEKLGYITQPHTSAGRVPTGKGYRFYVDSLLDDQTICGTSISSELAIRFGSAKKDNTALVKEAAKTLSSFSKYLAVATPLKTKNIVFQRIKFIKYESRQVLTLLISDNNVIKHTMSELDKEHTQIQLDIAAEHINERFSGMTIKKARERIIYQLYKDKAIRDDLINNLLLLCQEIIPSLDENTSLNEFAGTSNLPDFATMEQIKCILEAIEENHFMLKLLDHISDSSGIHVLVGMEDILPSMRELSMVISTYSYNDLTRGTVGIIGPTRMNYKKLIPAVDHTAKVLTKILSRN